MGNDPIHKVLDQLAEETLLIEADDLPTLGKIHGLFEELQKLAIDASLPYADQVSSTIGRITDVMLADSQNPEEDLNQTRLELKAWQKGLPSDDISSAPPKEEPSNTEDDPFLDNLRESTLKMETLAMSLEKDGGAEEIEELLRLIHSLKGESGVLGLDQLNELCHELETILQDGSVENPTDRLLSFLDWVKATQLSQGESQPFDSVMEIIHNGPSEETSDQQSMVDDSPSTPGKLSQDPSFYTDFSTESLEHIEAAEEILLESGEGDLGSDDINTIFRAFHTIKGVSSFLDLPDIQVLTHRAENVFEKMRSKKLSMSGEIQDLCFKVLDKVKGLIATLKESVSQGQLPPTDSEVPQFVKALDNVLNQKEGEEPSVSAPDIPAKAEGSGHKKVKEASSVKVATQRLDQVINLVGELVTSNAMISEEIQQHSSKTLMANVNHMKKNVNELQALAMSLRMVPIKNTFLKMSRIVRDLSKKMGKQIEFTMAGEDTELDRNMVDKLGDPLVHMVRNSADHGVESPEERQEAGKDPIGHVQLSAFHKGGNIVIQIKDDGKGIDRDVIFAKAVEKGLANPNQEMSDSEVFQMIFSAGFSTAKVVTDVSGRGVGMDVVRKNIENLRGRIEIESKKGEGTTFSIHLPLTLAIIDGMVIRVADQRYIVPTVAIHQTFSAQDQGQYSIQEKGKVLKFRDHLVPILDFEEIFGDPDCKGEGNILMVLGAGDKNVAILLDEIVTQQEVVIKSLHETMKNIKGLSGSAILPDGTVGLILDPVEISALLKESP